MSEGKEGRKDGRKKERRKEGRKKGGRNDGRKDTGWKGFRAKPREGGSSVTP